MKAVAVQTMPSVAIDASVRPDGTSPGRWRTAGAAKDEGAERERDRDNARGSAGRRASARARSAPPRTRSRRRRPRAGRAGLRADADAGDRRDARQPDQQPDEPAAAEPVVVAGEGRDRGPRCAGAGGDQQSPTASSTASDSALASSRPGECSSIAAKTTIGTPVRRARPRSSPRQAAIGSSRSAAIAVRPNTSTAGVTSRTATRISRYGIAQMTHIAPNSSHPRRVTGEVYQTAMTRAATEKRTRCGLPCRVPLACGAPSP